VVNGQQPLTGVYTSPVSLAITGTLTLDANHVPDAVFIFQAGTTLITATSSKVSLINGAQACNVFWPVGSSSTLGAGSTYAGTVMALASITGNNKATVLVDRQDTKHRCHDHIGIGDRTEVLAGAAFNSQKMVRIGDRLPIGTTPSRRT
jgi:hypothetical protein